MGWHGGRAGRRKLRWAGARPAYQGLYRGLDATGFAPGLLNAAWPASAKNPRKFLLHPPITEKEGLACGQPWQRRRVRSPAC